MSTRLTQLDYHVMIVGISETIRRDIRNGDSGFAAVQGLTLQKILPRVKDTEDIRRITDVLAECETARRKHCASIALA
jgi:hypothetical protein